MTDKVNITTAFVKELINEMLDGNKYNGDVFFRDRKLTGFGVKQQRSKVSYIVETKVNGKNYRKVIGNALVISNSAAREKAKKFLGDMAAGINVIELEKENKLKSITLEEAFNDYLAARKREEKTVKEYKRIMDVYLNDWKNKHLNDITDEMVEDLYKSGEKTPYMTNRITTLLSAIYNYAMVKYKKGNKRIITNNPCLIIRTMDKYQEFASNTKVEIYDIAKFWKATEPNMYDTPKMAQTKTLCRLCILMGCREQEVCLLKRKDIISQFAVLKIADTKNDRPHTIPYAKYTESIINQLCDGLSDDDYLFPAQTESGHMESHSKYIKAISTEAGVNFCLKDLRHSFTTYAAVHLKIDHCLVNVMTNHKNGDVSYDSYVTIGAPDFEKYRESFQMVEDFILENAKK